MLYDLQIRTQRNKDSIFYSLPTTVDLSKCTANLDYKFSPFYCEDFGGVNGLTVHIGKAQMQRLYASYAGDTFSQIESFLTQLIGFGLGTATICTDWDNNMILEMYRSIYSDPEYAEMKGLIPDVERCSGHAPEIKPVTSVAVASLPSKTTYTVGESFVKTGLSLNVTYSDGTTAVVSSGITCTGFSSDSAGTKVITATYGGKSTTFTVQVNPAQVTLTTIAVASMPVKTTYFIGESFNQNGLTLTAIYSDGSTKTIATGFVCTGFDSSAAGTKTITVTYGGKSVTFTVTVQSNASMAIRTPSTGTIKYGYTLILHTQTANLPAGARINWTVSGSGVTIQPSADSFDCSVQSVSSGTATLSDGSIGGWSTNPNAEKAPALSPVPKTMPAQDLIVYAKKSFASGMADDILNSLREKSLSKEFWKAQYPLFWVFPYIWYHIFYFFSDLFH